MSGSAVDPEREIRCGGCGHRYRISAWVELPTVQMLTAADVHEHVTTWPEGTVVTVRTCRACGCKMARTVRIDSTARAVASS